MRKIGLIGAIFASLIAMQVNAVTLTVEPLAGTKMTTAIEGIGSLVFEDEDNATLLTLTVPLL